ncbi:MAG: CAP domain-containing protein [Candidatus Bipolaricaulia bacterium]
MGRFAKALTFGLLALLFLSSLSQTGSATTIEQAVDRNGNCIIEDQEILRAVEYWVTGEPLPGTGGLTISDAKILQLMALWINGASVCATPTDHTPSVIGLSIDPNPALASDSDHGIMNYFDLLIQFTDPQRDIAQALIHVVWPDGDADDYTEAVPAQGSTSGVFRSEDYWTDTSGTISFTVVLVDRAGDRSSPYTRSFSVISGGPPPTDHTPVITGINCPSEIPVGRTATCSVGFSDSRGDITEARFVKVAGSPGSTSFDPQVYGQTSGSFSFNIECSSSTPQQTMEVTLADEAGNRSGPAYFSYTCVEAGPQDVAQAFLATINQYRSQSGQCWDLAAQAWTSWPASASRNLALSTPLNNAAIYHSQFMADHDCFAHVCPGEADLVTRIESFGYTGWTSYGENIYKAPQGLETPEAAFEAWRNSPGHNRNMLTCQFEEIGVGRVYDADSGYWYWTTDFGSR